MSTFYDPSMLQMYAAQGFNPPEDEYAQITGMDQQQTQYGGNQMGYQAGSQNNALVGSGMNPYMLDTFGMGQYYRPYGNLAQQQQVPQQPYYQVPTEYIPEGTPGLAPSSPQAGGPDMSFYESLFKDPRFTSTGFANAGEDYYGSTYGFNTKALQDAYDPSELISKGVMDEYNQYTDDFTKYIDQQGQQTYGTAQPYSLAWQGMITDPRKLNISYSKGGGGA